MKTLAQILALVGFSAGIYSCGVSSVADESTAKFTENQTQIQAYLTANKLTAQKTPYGVYYIVTKANPTGKSVVIGDQMIFHYVASLLDGTKFDSTSVLTNSPVKLPFGVRYNNPAGAIVDAFTFLHQGEKVTLLIPSDLGYGSSAVNIVPAYSVLKYDVNIVAFNTEIQQIKNYIADKKLTVTDTTATNLRYIRTKTGTGDALKAGQNVTVKYVGKLLNGTVFDSTGTTSNPSYSFILGSSSSIPGFNEGTLKMKVGEKATIIFPSALGYGVTGVINQTTGSSTIPPYSPLSFDIEVVGVK